ncbi:MAG: Na+/H+ antiporter subunit E [Anaerolineae bacterium]
METNPYRRAAEALKTLHHEIQDLQIVCPLCSASVPLRGLQSASESSSKEHWKLIFACPSCGLISAFDTSRLSAKQLRAIQGSAWSAKLRQYFADKAPDELSMKEKPKVSHLVAVFVISMLTWFVLTGSLNLIDVLWGTIVSLMVARLSYQFVRFDLPHWMSSPRRWLHFADLLIEFLRQIVVQNITLSIRVLRADLPIRPGIVAIPTKLRNEVALTVLGSLITLTPDTVTLDIDQRKGLIYVHWIDVKTTDPQEAYQLIAAALEERIIRWLE